jgi:hypothetical protein
MKMNILNVLNINKDVLPIVNHLKANSKFDLKGVNKFFYHKDINQELIKLVSQN